VNGALEHFEVAAADYEAHAEARPEFAERFALWTAAIDRAAPSGGAGATAIDLGCGPGHLTLVLAERGFHTVAIDGTAAMLSRTRERLERHGIADADLRRHVLPLPAEVVAEFESTAALILMSSVIEYVDEDVDTLRQCARLLAPGGRLLVSFPNSRSLYWRLQSLLRRTPVFPRSDYQHQRHQYDARAIRDMSYAAGLELRRITFFALPLQRYTERLVARRRPRLATLFLTDLERRSCRRSR
jgi:SAM-dependent methyltransferase